jgi:hypothetical protein
MFTKLIASVLTVVVSARDPINFFSKLECDSCGDFEQKFIEDGSMWSLTAKTILINPDESSRTYSSVYDS